MVLVMVFPDSVSQIRGVRREPLISGSSPGSFEAEDVGARWAESYGGPASSSTIVMEQCSDSMNGYQALSTAGKPIYGWVGVVNRTIVEMNGKAGVPSLIETKERVLLWPAKSMAPQHLIEDKRQDSHGEQEGGGGTSSHSHSHVRACKCKGGPKLLSLKQTRFCPMDWS